MIEFNPYDKTFAHDPYPTYKRLRDEAPVYHCEPLNFWALSRFADVLEAHRDFKTFSSAGGVTIEGFDAMVPLLIVKDPPSTNGTRRSSRASSRRIAWALSSPSSVIS